MKTEIIKELIAEFKNSDLTKLEVNFDDIELKLEREKEVHVQSVPMQDSIAQVVPQAVAKTEVNINTEEPISNKENEVRSPMVGTFYASSTPGGESFVKVGDSVKKGDVLCIVEAMKLMNEVEAEKDGKISAVLVQNEEMVEFDQPLFIME